MIYNNINVDSLQKHFFPYKSNFDRKLSKESSKQTKIVKYDIFSINEANIAHRIKGHIPYYSDYYLILEDYNNLNMDIIDDRLLEKLKYTDMNNKISKEYLLFKYDRNIDSAIDFADFLYHSTSIKRLLFETIHIFSHLIKSLIMLNNDCFICYFNFSPQNIVFLSPCRGEPLLQNFRLSLRLSKCKNYDDYYNSYFLPILMKIDDFTYQPFEIHILYFMEIHQLNTISLSFIDDFCEIFVKNMSILRFFSDKYKNNYKLSCVELLKGYINKTKKDIVEDIFERNNKWDVYGISLLYIHVFASISRVFSLKDTFINKMIFFLSRNIHPDSKKRLTLDETMNKWNQLLQDQTCWNFVKDLENDKFGRLLDELSK